MPAFGLRLPGTFAAAFAADFRTSGAAPRMPRSTPRFSSVEPARMAMPARMVRVTGPMGSDESDCASASVRLVGWAWSLLAAEIHGDDVGAVFQPGIARAALGESFSASCSGSSTSSAIPAVWNWRPKSTAGSTKAVIALNGTTRVEDLVEREADAEAFGVT
jgi:hypothetical protein